MTALVHRWSGDGWLLAERHGPCDAATLVWVHDPGEPSLRFTSIAYRELADWRHLLVNLPGHGRSLHPREPIPLPVLVEELATLIGRHGHEGSALIGHSMGAVLGTPLLEEHPKLVHGS